MAASDPTPPPATEPNPPVLSPPPRWHLRAHPSPTVWPNRLAPAGPPSHLRRRPYRYEPPPPPPLPASHSMWLRATLNYPRILVICRILPQAQRRSPHGSRWSRTALHQLTGTSVVQIENSVVPRISANLCQPSPDTSHTPYGTLLATPHAPHHPESKSPPPDTRHLSTADTRRASER